MAIDRRQLLAGAGAAALWTALPRAARAAAAGPRYLTAFDDHAGGHFAGATDEAGTLLWQVELPERGHDLCVSPDGRHVALTARRPGRFARIVDAATGAEVKRFDAPAGRTFNGHGIYSRDGAFLFTTENAYDEQRGVIGVWDVADNYARAGEIGSGGLDAHQVILLADDTLAVANGGLLMHPDSGRTVLNLPDMRSNLTIVSPKSGEVLAAMDCDALAPYLCLHHLALAPDGTITVAGQAQTPMAEAGPLLFAWKPGGEARVLDIPMEDQARLEGYMGSTAICRSGRYVATTSPRGGMLFIHALADGAVVAALEIRDVCGISAAAGHADGFLFTAGTGESGLWTPDAGKQVTGEQPRHWDNHLSPLRG